MKSRTLGALALLALASGVAPSWGWAQPAVGVQVVHEAGAAASKGWTWEALVNAVERTSPLMHAANAGLNEFEAKLSQAEWAIFPSLRVNAGATVIPGVTGEAGNPETNFDIWGYYFQVEVTAVQPLWTFGKISALKRAASHGVDVGQARLDAARWELHLRLGQAYEGALFAMQAKELLAEGRKWLDRASEDFENKRDDDAEDYDQVQHLRLKTRIADFEALEATNALMTVQSQAALRLLLSRGRGQPVELALDRLVPIEITPLSGDQYVAIAIDRQPEMREARAGVKAFHALADNKKAQLLPDLVLIGTMTSKTSNQTQLDEKSSFLSKYNGTSGGGILALRWNLDGPRTLYAYEEARAKALRTQHEMQVGQDLLELKVLGLTQKLLNSQRLVGAFARAEKTSRGWLNSTMNRYENGFGNFKDVLDAVLQYYDKRLNYLRLVFEHNVLVRELSQAVGADITQLKPGQIPAPQVAP